MGILSTIKNFINEITDTKSVGTVQPAKKEEKKSNIKVIECKNVDKNVDTIEIKNKNIQKNEAQNQVHKRGMREIKASIENKCQANGLDFRKLSKYFGDVAGITMEEFKQLPQEEQTFILEVIDHELDRLIMLKRKHKLSKHADKEALVRCEAQNTYEAVNEGHFKNVNDFEKHREDIKKQLGEDFEKLSPQEKGERFKAYAEKRAEACRAELNKRFRHLPEAERKAEIKKAEAQQNAVTKAEFIDIIATEDSETAVEAMVILNGKDMAYGARTILETRVDKAERTRAADYIKFEKAEELVKSYAERGCEPDEQTIEEFTNTIVMYKSTEGVNEYQNAYNERRQQYESGEAQSPLMDKFFKSTAKGIGQGAMNNVNMTSDEKAKFIAKWIEDAKQYKDCEEVTKKVIKELETNPEYKELAKKVQEERKIIQQQREGKSGRKTESKKTPVTSQSHKTPSQNNTIPVQKNETPSLNKIATKKGTNNTLQKKVANKVVVANKVKTLGLSEAVKEYGHASVIKTILENQNLKYLRPQLSAYLKTYNINALKQITNHCSDSSFVYICSVVNPDLVDDLKESRNHLCYSANKQLEMMEKKNETRKESIV